MSLKFSLPDQLPDKGFFIRLNLRELPELSFDIHAYLNPDQGKSRASCKAKTLSVYGRGPGSQAAEKPVLMIPVKADLVHSVGKSEHNVLELELRTLDGEILPDDIIKPEQPLLESLP